MSNWQIDKYLNQIEHSVCSLSRAQFHELRRVMAGYAAAAVMDSSIAKEAMDVVLQEEEYQEHLKSPVDKDDCELLTVKKLMNKFSKCSPYAVITGSIDVSTSEDDADRRVFGHGVEVLDVENEVTICFNEGYYNY